ncbi:hypothetical protein Leryth_019103 [Lithospermum erythrorhizon]|nr:hypothetical protein Leryth_019103 [Lithospermum erythrorhizon]
MSNKANKVPDWLNSSIWSSPTTPATSPPSSSSHPLSDDVTDRVIKSSKPAPQPVTEPPKTVAIRKKEAAAVRDPLNSSGRNSNYNSDDEEEREGGTKGGFIMGAAEASSRKSQILQELSRKVINMGELRRLASQGIPDGGGLRATVWKLLLGYLPRDRSLWSTELSKKRSQYKNFKDDLLMNPVSYGILSLILFLLSYPSLGFLRTLKSWTNLISK